MFTKSFCSSLLPEAVSPTKLSYQHIMYGRCCYMIYHWTPTRHDGTFSANVWTVSDLEFMIFYAYDNHFPSPEWKTSESVRSTVLYLFLCPTGSHH